MSGLLAGFLGGVAKGGLNIIGEQEQQAREEQQRKAVLGDRIALERELSGIRQDEAGTIAKRRAEVDEQGRQRRVQAVDGRLEEGARSHWSQMAEAKRVETLAALRAEREAKGQPVDDAALAAEADRKLKVEEERQRLAFMKNPKNRAAAAVEEGFADPLALAQMDSRTEIAQISADARLAVAQAQAEVQNARTAAQMEIAQAKLGQAQARLEAQQAKDATGKAPPGYRWTQTGDLEPIKGGPADQKIAGAFNADTAQLAGTTDSLNRLALTANQLMSHPGLSGIVGLQGKLPSIPGGDAANAQAILETLKSQVGFGVLQAMRDASKTGGALGAVSDAEGKRLEANLAALSQSQDIDQFRASLRQILDYSEGAKGRLREAFNLKHGDRQGAAGGAVGPVDGGNNVPVINKPERLKSLRSGDVFRAPDGSLRRVP